MSITYFPFQPGPRSAQADGVLQGTYPSVQFNAQEVGGEYQEIREINGALWYVTNAQYNTAAALAPTAANAWTQVLGSAVSYAFTYVNGTLTGYTAAATGISGSAITFTINPFTFGAISGTTATFSGAVATGPLTVTGNATVSGTEAVTGSFSMGYSFMRNKIINGGMAIDQRNNGVSITPTNFQYSVDRWQAQLTAASKYSLQQNAGGVTPPPGFSNYLGCTSLSAYAVATGDTFGVNQSFEGFTVTDLAFGTASALPVALSFYVRSTLTGTFGGSLSNYAHTRSYPFTYTIATANTWTRVSVSIPGDTGGSWVSGNNAGSLILQLGLGSGSTFSGPVGAWASADYRTATGAVSVVGTSGATLYVTGVQFETGTLATPFEQRQYGTELQLCQRYCYATNSATVNVAPFALGTFYSTTLFLAPLRFPVTMRSVPGGVFTAPATFTLATNASSVSVSSIAINQASPDCVDISCACAGVVAGTSGVLSANTTNSAQMTFSAEV